MASSPRSSCSSSYSMAPSFSTLPVMALREKIVEKILDNRVTLIVGDTGCGKSSQVPQFLLEHGLEPILCTQPRRFAVVAVAQMVARARNCEVGGEVGYHIGHSKVTTSRSKIIFKTSGVLLDEMLDKGVAALQYSAIILDEVHERSVESDLVLACIKQFMLRKANIRLVLMSATADISRYKDYFKDLGRDERVEVLAIPCTPQQTVFQRKVVYLEQVTDLLGDKSWSLLDEYFRGSTPSCSSIEIKLQMQVLIRDLVLHIHANEPNIEKSILVFLPTYYALEQQWSLLLSSRFSFDLHILHSSIDIGKALMALRISTTRRKVILATNIAESSVTIPEVAFVIDSCLSLQVFWDSNRKREIAELAWVSKSQAEQRKGRTGRTCDGQVYRLVTRTFYTSLAEHERPSILRLSLRQQVLMICCSESRAINDPKVLLQKVLDPPDPEVVKDAMTLLTHLRAVVVPDSPRSRSEPTFYGLLLASFRLSFDAAVLVVKFGEIGLLREGILIGVLVDAQPLPIVQPFGEEYLFAQYVNKYFQGKIDEMVFLEKKETVFMGNFCAFQFWQRVFKDNCRLARLKQIVGVHNEPTVVQPLILKHEEEWCHFHNLVQTSLQHVSDMYEDIIHKIHRFRPQFLAKTNGLPSYHHEFSHTCLHFVPVVDMDVQTKSCCSAAPYVAAMDFNCKIIAEKLVRVVKEMRVQLTQDTTEDQGHKDSDEIVSQIMNLQLTLCRYFINGTCKRGSQCFFSHSLVGKRPLCKFFFSFQGCRNGDSCFFSHDEGPVASSSDSPSLCLPESEVAVRNSLCCLLPSNSDDCILLLGDDEHLSYSSSLLSYQNTLKIVAINSHPYVDTTKELPAGVTVQWGVSEPLLSVVTEKAKHSIPWENVKCVFWFAKFLGHEESEEQQLSVQKFFECFAIRLLADSLHDVRVILAMNNIKFSQLQVEKLGRECFFYLVESFAFDQSNFGEFPCESGRNKPSQVSKPIWYVFHLHPPANLQFGDHSSDLWEGLYNGQRQETLLFSRLDAGSGL